jgi:hypothetical protein
MTDPAQADDIFDAQVQKNVADKNVERQAMNKAAGSPLEARD